MVRARPKAGRILAFWRTLDWQPLKTRGFCSVLCGFRPGAMCANYGGVVLAVKSGAGAKFAHLASTDRQAIDEILLSTKRDLPNYWKN